MTRYRIERLVAGCLWDVVAYPPGDLNVATRILNLLRDQKPRRSLRLVRETLEVIDPSPITRSPT